LEVTAVVAEHSLYFANFMVSQISVSLTKFNFDCLYCSCHSLCRKAKKTSNKKTGFGAKV